MADRIILPRALDANGDIVTDATAYFFKAGTETPLTVYSDEGAAIPLGVSVAGDGEAVFPTCYASEAVKLDVRTALGASLPGFPSDNWYLATNNGASASGVAFSPITGNAATNVQAAIAYLTGLWGAVTSYGKTLMASTSAANALTVLGLSATSAELSLMSGITAINDEDDMASDSATALVTQQSVKAYVDGLFSPAYSPALATMTYGTAHTFAHGITSPGRVETYIECATTEHGYSTGDQIMLEGDSRSTTYGTITVRDATNITVLVGASGVQAFDKSTAATVTLTAANWKIGVKVWKA